MRLKAWNANQEPIVRGTFQESEHCRVELRLTIGSLKCSVSLNQRREIHGSRTIECRPRFERVRAEL